MTACQPKLSRKRQLLAAIQTDCESLAPMGADDGLIRLEVGGDFTPEQAMNERNLALINLSKLPNVPGATVGKGSFTSEVVGSGSLANTPDADVYLRASGLERINLSYLDIKVPPASEEIAKNAIIVGATSGATGRVAVPIDARTTRVFIELISGNFQADESINVQGGSTGVFTALAAEQTGGFEYSPISQDFEFASIQSEEDGLVKMMRGALLNFSVSAEASGIGKFEWEATGVIDKTALIVGADAVVGGPTIAKGTLLYSTTSGNKTIELQRFYDSADPEAAIIVYRLVSGSAVADNDVFLDAGAANGFTIDGTPTKAYVRDQAMTTGVAFRTTIPPVLQDARCKIGSFSPVINSINFDLGNNVISRVNANDPTGLVSSYITDRAPSGSFDPEMVSASSFDFMNNWFSGGTFAGQFKFGNQEGNTIWIIIPAMQAQNASQGEREGMDTVGWDFNATGSDNSEFSIVFV